ncbi:hypothetical protein LOZ64_001611 [Ophidiomyces ophidiicola]|nr:hypothetical protein LOZ64_001611 [Ophidiomyces ophidiicola]KAI2006468.1 hypothetical protein LOZ49_004999 [Ophidiomyces ophidiicola]KAI2023241.1 hypothetical protein LOZ46_001572 [Ophidiomyces ophidiicola]KAI2140982.1 hypothetical protein LOZ29_001941 [Ophidiomyces ophidiicola]KAI2142559.1 hypothetical protein LOZ28_002094 [Ophidiomyces ophidiicola]
MAQSPTDNSSDLQSTPQGSTGASLASSSDKENRASPTASRAEKRKQGGSSAQARTTTSTMEDTSNKRRRVSDRVHVEKVHRDKLADLGDTSLYDPDQDPEERRAIRRSLRELTNKMNDSRAEYLQTRSRGIHDTVTKANELFMSVKQTSDATIDSRLLVAAADLSYKRTAQAVLGDSAAGIDVDEFVSKCISFMRGGATDEASSSSQQLSSQRRRRRTDGGNIEEYEDEDDTLNWDVLGRQACLPYNLRPSLSGFLYGPLSVQKRTRQVTQRRARQERIDPSQAVRPQQLQAEDLEKLETANLTAICTEIRKILVTKQQSGEARATNELSKLKEPTQDQIREVVDKYDLADDGGVPLFKFCINPNSFGQTVENLFYVSFLVRDGSVGVYTDSKQLPTLHPSKPVTASEARDQGIEKFQAVFSLDFETWRDLIEVFDIKKPLIPHRDEEEQRGQTALASQRL